MAMLRVVADGGNCCGLKHIYGFGTKPTENQQAYLTKGTRESTGSKPVPYGHHYGGDHGQRDTDAVRVDLPRQSGEMRLYDLIETLRKSGIKRQLVQCTLIDGCGAGSDGSPDWVILEQYLNLRDWCHQREWYPVLEKAGFKQVNRWMNSNSGNYVTCWQLVMCPDWEKKWLEDKLFTQKEEPKKAKPAPFG